MEITNELLAAYAEGNVTPEERKQVRAYLTEHTSQLESVMLMMDSDDDVDVKPQKKDISFMGNPSRLNQIPSFNAAFVPDSSSYTMRNTVSVSKEPLLFDKMLDDLLNEVTKM